MGAFGELVAGTAEGREGRAWQHMGDSEAVRGLLGRVCEERCYGARHHREAYQHRVNLQKQGDTASYAGRITAENSPSGPYRGTSLVWFPSEGGSVAGLVNGTDGFGADAHILGRPGYRRRLKALLRLHEGRIWVKPDLLDLETEVPSAVSSAWPEIPSALKSDARVIYAATTVRSSEDGEQVADLLDLFFDEHGTPLTGEAKVRWNRRTQAIAGAVFPSWSEEQVLALLRERRFVVLEGPPGTGNTRLAWRIADRIGAATRIQFIEGRAGRVARRLRLELLPLLRDYLDERMCGSASEAFAGLADRVESRLLEPALHEGAAARLLRARVSDLRVQVGAGRIKRPSSAFRVGASGRVAEAMEAMGWVAEERGLGGSRVLDRMSWDLPIDEVWEAWMDAFVADLAPRCGFRALRRGYTTRRIHWSTSTSSMRTLVPDSGLCGPDRLVWVDAKYKAHLQLLAHRGWSGLDEGTRDAHRADFHQALAQAALDEVEHVDSLLVYPELSPDGRRRPAIATVASGRRRVRLLLVELPFGFRSPDHRESTLADWRPLLAA